MRSLPVIVGGILCACGGEPRGAVVTIPHAPQVAAAIPSPSEHAIALDKLVYGEASTREWDAIQLTLPDAYGWDNVNFILVPSVISIQYGNEDDFHAILGAFVMHVPHSDKPGACARVFEDWAQEWLDAFDTNYTKGRSWSAPWGATTMEGGDVLGKVATIVARGTYQCAYAVYPAWKDDCLVLGLAVPNRGEEAKAKALRDRFARELFPSVKVTAPTPPNQHAP
jgi:hypothetical protein